MSLDPIKTREFRETLAKQPRSELLRIVKMQDKDLYDQVMQIERVFREKLTHLKWSDGMPITGRDLTNEELVLLIDEPFEIQQHLLDMGINAEKQRELHAISDPVTWVKTFLRDEDGDPIAPRVYQILPMRSESHRKILRWGRRTGKSFYMALTMLHKAMTIPNYKVIVVAPQIKHTKILYDEIISIIENNPYVESNVNRYIQTPSPEINFITGSFIRFFTAGTKSAGNADSARGQEADLIVLDEMDYLHPDDLIALLAMLQDTRKNKGKKILIGASTPTGSHEVFYEWCTSPKSLFTEFYFPSYVNPEWSDEMEQEMRGLYRTVNAYRHEIEADWGENAEGVYPRRYLDIAFAKDNEWDYKDHRVNGDSDFFIGVDWDKYGAGTNIVVLERYSRNYIDKSLAGKFRIAFREETVREEFTYTNAVRRVIELNERFNPKFIYVDRGAGEVQVELLHEAGINNPFSGLGKKVKGISFKEIIEARDPFTKQPRRMETKPFMVDNLYQFLENELIAVPNDDNELYHQLLSYVVLRTSQNGNPVFGSLNDNPDHAHDALLLACLAFTENYGDFFNLNLATESKVISNKFFIPMFAPEAGKKEFNEKIRSENPSIPSPYEPPDAIIDQQVSKITRAMPFSTGRGSKSAIRRKSF